MSVSVTSSVQPSVRASSSAGAQPTRFSRARFALLVLLGVYPLITMLLYVILPLTETWPIWQRTLVIAPIMVSIMVGGLIPGVQRFFRGFINPARR